jgi:hypothetical protein
MAQKIRERMNKWYSIKLKSSAQQKKQSLDSRDCPQNGRKTFASYSSDEVLISRVYRKFKKLKLQRITTQ